MPDRVIVFLDYQNMYQGARSAFHVFGAPHWQGQVDPVRLALHLVADSPFDRELAQVRIYRGQPDSKLDPKGYGASRRQHAAWLRSPYVHLVTRPLRYPSGWPTRGLPGEKPTEKGIDVQIALDYALMAERGQYDVGILMSTDTDLKPALEEVAEMAHGKVHAPRPEVAAWGADGRHNRRLSIKSARNLWCHWLDKATYQAVQDSTDYTVP
ncbi:hypothetical protein GCM10023196_034300 [Actinoallomurus vinaceus]|uniref:NYN domain-containing protein n=1 Tax=Actinoallomurus vinaceus TaxID=1080074 RepID=A0ABP8U8G7_9ACTN